MPVTMQNFFKEMPTELILNIFSYLPIEDVLGLDRLEKAVLKINKPPFFWANRLKDQYNLEVVQDEDASKKFMAVYLYKTAILLAKHPLAEYYEKAESYFTRAKQLFELLEAKKTADAGWLKFFLAEMHCKKYIKEADFLTGISLLLELNGQYQHRHPEACYLLANIYDGSSPWSSGTEIKIDIGSSIYIRWAAEAGHAKAQAIFGQLLIQDEDFLQSLGIEADSAQGWNYIFQSMQKKDIEAIDFIIDALQKETIAPENIKQKLAKRQLNRLAEIESDFGLKDISALQLLLFELKAEAGDKSAIHYFINTYADQKTLELFGTYQHVAGSGPNWPELQDVLPNSERLLSYLRLGLAFGDSLSAACLALTYLDNKSLNYNPQEALGVVKKGLNLGSATCFFILGRFYLLGKEELKIQPELAKAVSYFQQAVAIDRNYYGRIATFYAELGSRADFIDWAIQGLQAKDWLSCRYLSCYVAMRLFKEWNFSRPEKLNIALSEQLMDLEFGGLARIGEEKLDKLIEAVCDFCEYPRLSNEVVTKSLQLT